MTTEVQTLTRPKTAHSPKTWGYDFNHPRGRFMRFTDWVKTRVVLKPNTFTCVKDLYFTYKADTQPEEQITEDLFYKEIGPVMYGLGIKPGRIRGKVGRGFLGISISNTIL